MADPSTVAFNVVIQVPEERPYYPDGRFSVEALRGRVYEMAYLTYKGPYTNREEAYNAVFGRNLFQWIPADRCSEGGLCEIETREWCRRSGRWRFRFL